MGLRDSASRPFERLKNRLAEGGHERRNGSMSDNQEGRELDIEIGKSSRLHPETEDVVGSGPSREERDNDSEGAIQVDPPTSAPSTSHGGSGEPNTNIVTAAIPDIAQEDLHPVADDPSVVENKSTWKSTASATVRLVLLLIRESADAFVPLKAVAGSVVFVLKDFEQTRVNSLAIESLVSMIFALERLFHTPIFEDDFKERERRAKLESILQNIARDLVPLGRQGKFNSFLKNVQNASKLGDLVEDVHKAVIDYQTVLEQDIYDKSCQIAGDVDQILLHSVHRTVEARHHRQGPRGGVREDILLRLENISKDVDRLSRLIPLIDAYFTL